MKTRRTFFLFLPILILFLAAAGAAQQRFYIDLKDRSDDLFKVVLKPEKLSAENKIYQFASTAPGTYERMDIGRFVKSFFAYNKEGDEIPVENISVNQWSVSSPEKVDKIVYTIEDTWDSKLKCL